MNFNELSKVHIKRIDAKSIVFTEKVGRWCKLPYQSHKKGCPNYNKNNLCPPLAPYLETLTHEYIYFYLIYVTFDFAKYKQLRKEEHLKWTDKQVACVLYWQSSIRKILKTYIKELIIKNNLKDFYLLWCGSGLKDKYFKHFQDPIYSMEAVGIDVIKTMKNNSINIEIKPTKEIKLVSLLSINKK